MPTTKTVVTTFMGDNPMTSSELILVLGALFIFILAFWYAMGTERRREERKAQEEKDSAYLATHNLALGKKVSILNEDGDTCASGELLEIVSPGHVVVRTKEETQCIPLSQVVPFRRHYMRGSLN